MSDSLWPHGCSSPGSSVHRILQARILEWLPCPPPGDLPDPGIQPKSPMSPALAADSLPLCHLASPSLSTKFQIKREEKKYWIVYRTSQVEPVVKNLPANSGDTREVGLSPGPGRPPRGGHGYPLQSSCLENPMDRGAWWATVHRVAKSQIQLKQLSTHTCI